MCDFNEVEYALRIHISFLLGPQLLLNLIKNLKLLTPLSTISNFCMIIGLILVFFYMIEDDITLENEKLRIYKWAEFPIFIGITLFALEAVGVVSTAWLLKGRLSYSCRFLNVTVISSVKINSAVKDLTEANSLSVT